jgi:hypothetical protein
MNTKNETKPDVANLLGYLNIAANFRNHEFNIQMLRNAIFTGTQAITLGCYAATIQRYSLSALVIAFFGGVVLSIIWWLYYRASLYWARFWECRCREVNDKVVTTLGSGVNIFAEHPAGADEKAPPIKFGGRTIKYRGSVRNILMAVPIVFCFLWVGLAIAAGIALSHHGLIVPTEGIQPQLLPPNATIP